MKKRADAGGKVLVSPMNPSAVLCGFHLCMLTSLRFSFKNCKTQSFLVFWHPLKQFLRLFSEQFLAQPPSPLTLLIWAVLISCSSHSESVPCLSPGFSWVAGCAFWIFLEVHCSNLYFLISMTFSVCLCVQIYPCKCRIFPTPAWPPHAFIIFLLFFSNTNFKFGVLSWWKQGDIIWLTMYG